MGFIQRRAYEAERGAMQAVVRAINDLPPRMSLSHEPATVPCHIIHEWHQSVAIRTSRGNTAVYHCQSRWWALPLTDAQLAHYAGWQPYRREKDGGFSFREISLGSFRDDLGPIRGGASALAQGLASGQLRPTMPFASTPEEADDLGDDDSMIDFDDFLTDMDLGGFLTEWGTPLDWLSQGTSWKSADFDDRVYLLVKLEDDTLLSFVGDWESDWALVVLQYRATLSDVSWTLTLKQGHGRDVLSERDWLMPPLADSARLLASMVEEALRQAQQEHSGIGLRAIRDAQLTWSVFSGDPDASLDLAEEALDANGNPEDLPRNFVGALLYLGEKDIDNAQRSRLGALITRLGGVS